MDISYYNTIIPPKRSGNTYDNYIYIHMNGILADKEVIQLSTSKSHALALTSDGKVYSWGNNNCGQLGDGTTQFSIVPIAVDMSGVLADKVITEIYAGRNHSIAVDEGGKVYAWGRGGIGSGKILDSLVPQCV